MFRRPPLDVGLGLEREASRKLTAARSNRGSVGRQRAVDDSEVRWVIDVIVRSLEAGMVQRVGKVGAQLQTEALPKVEFLSQG